ncbi:carboxymuconolactone decarboxylase family protein [Streptomyces polyrhachis]|uniref:Carboxymuconolactone decarboxylase family protein n=1 Tax=Streptomyces polyrhachis TaxID=1282885 RepID=A0ABW2GGR6_9ACTN
MLTRKVTPTAALPEPNELTDPPDTPAPQKPSEPESLALIALRIDQLKGCCPCVHARHAELVELGASAERIAFVAAWREAPCYTESERLALALAEACSHPAATGLASSVGTHSA